MDAPTSQAPPTEQGDLVPWKAPATWPTAVGVISIVLGSLGALVWAWSALAPLFMGTFATFASANHPEMNATIQAQKDTAVWTVSAGSLNTITSLLLMISGIGLANRSPWSPGAARLWAMLKIPVAIFAVIATGITQRAMYQAMAKQPNGPSAAAAGMGSALTVFTGALSLAWGWAFPIFMLIWLSRPKVRAEIAGWKKS